VLSATRGIEGENAEAARTRFRTSLWDDLFPTMRNISEVKLEKHVTVDQCVAGEGGIEYIFTSSYTDDLDAPIDLSYINMTSYSILNYISHLSPP